MATKPAHVVKMKVLLVEDNPDDAALLQLALKDAGNEVIEIKHVERLAAALNLLAEESFDLVLLDLSLPDSHGVDTVERVAAHAPWAPIVVMTGLDDENTGLEAVRKGAQDYLVKGNTDGPLTLRLMRYARERKWGEQQLKQAIAALHQSQQELLATISQLNRSHAELKIAQIGLIESAKKESLGRLSAGIVRELKEPLATLILGVDYFHHHVGRSDPEHAPALKKMLDAVKRADEVINAFQEFAGPSNLHLQPADLGEIARQSLALVQTDLTAHGIAPREDYAAELPALDLDVNKIQQVFLSFFMNAIEAMSNPGTLIVRTGIQRLSESDIKATVGDPADLPRYYPGVLIVFAEIEDSGTGIPPEHATRIFDPFYTTRDQREATGLGLTVARKIVELHGGRIGLANRPEGGACATIFFKAP